MRSQTVCARRSTPGSTPLAQRLVERTLSTDLGVSHIPVREALTKLEDEGLVVRLPRRGARVAELSPVSIAEISSMRVLLEGFVVRRVTERWTPRCERDLMRLADRMVAAARRGDTAAVLELDQRFHERLWQQADHSILIEVATHMRGAHQRLPARDDPDALARRTCCTRHDAPGPDQGDRRR